MSQKLSRRDALKALAAATGAVALSSVPNKWVTPMVEIGALPAHAQSSVGLTITQLRVQTFECYYVASLAYIDPNNVVNGDTTVMGVVCTNKSYALTIAQLTRPQRRGALDTSFQLNFPIDVGCCLVGGNVSAQFNASGILSNIFSTMALGACLSGDTEIDTPLGAVRVTDLKVGMPVWTLDATGVRTQAVIAQTIRRPVSPSASIVHLALSDGRAVMVSARHPTTDGRTIGDLAVGDVLDGARVVKADTIPYDQPAKYDVLPAGETGSYWANGIPMNSTIEIMEKHRVPTLA